MDNNKLFYVGLKAFIEKEGKLLVLRERETPYTKERAWELPGGRIQPEETEAKLEAILLREVEEECGPGLKVDVGPVVHVFRRQFSNGEWVFWLVIIVNTGKEIYALARSIVSMLGYRPRKWLSTSL